MAGCYPLDGGFGFLEVTNSRAALGVFSWASFCFSLRASEASAAAVTAGQALDALDLNSGNSVDEKIINLSSALNEIDVHFNAVKAQNVVAKQQLNNLNDGKFNLQFDKEFSYSTNDLADIVGIINEAKEFLKIRYLLL